MAPAAIETEEDDPVVAEYDVFITPEVEEQIYLLQYLNRAPDYPFTDATGCRPSEMRIKQESGFIEVDVPVNVRQNFNRPMGVRWGESVRKTKGQGQKAWGIASGFERVHVPRLGGRPGASGEQTAADEEDKVDEYIQNFEDANEKGHVLNTQTLGGQIIKENAGYSNYMIGTFRDNQLHLTRLTGIVQMRTQFNHLDATAYLETLARRREKESQEGVKPSEPRALIPTVKKGAGNTSVEKSQAFLQHAHEEKWTKLQYLDENMDEAYGMYHERLFVQDPGSSPKLHSSMNNDRYLEAISAPSSDKSGKRKPLTKRQVHEIDISDDSDNPANEAQPSK
ncbi:hypothetical protein K469DRAFT_627806 [Zopfia rhizophila CBS 207.26]|uniref:DNA-directed RNA polymerase III subunit Rpc5 n=1 Tax=Zopfia rhizophila CBS 207.26 TaxID=1314779 RepID=A0A6A6EAT3_9PEZI|nr:hypothetical protein K469DRAFT_627806 [Zopfia rhizophila CBS 207.26]